jgi:hypothetical protein
VAGEEGLLSLKCDWDSQSHPRAIDWQNCCPDRLSECQTAALLSSRRHFIKALALPLASGLLGCIRAENNEIADPRATGGMDIMTILGIVIYIVWRLKDFTRR